MRTLRQAIVLTILCNLFLNGCKDPYEPTFEARDLDPILIVEGFINAFGPHSTYTLGYAIPIADLDAEVAGGNDNIPVTNASLNIEAENGPVYPSQPAAAPGSYRVLHPQLDTNIRYRLRIEIGGDIYLSDFVDVKISPEIGEITWAETEEGIQLYVSTEDTDNNSRYYRWEFEEAWRFTTPYVSTLIYDYDHAVVRMRTPEERVETCFMEESSTDILLSTSEGMSQDVIDRYPIHFIPRLSDKLGWRYAILVKQWVMSREAFVYWDLLKENSENLGNVFGPMPTEVRGNISHIDNPLRPVIGMVEAIGVAEKRIYIDYLGISWALEARSELGTDCFVRVIHGEDGPTGIHAFMYENRNTFILFQDFDPGVRTYVTTRSCMDCTVRGKLEAPSFWEE